MQTKIIGLVIAVVVVVLVVVGVAVNQRGGTPVTAPVGDNGADGNELNELHEGEMMTEGVVDDVVSDSFEQAILSAVGEYSGDGLAARMTNGERFLHVVEANIEAPATGKFYEGWLVKKQPALTFVSTGRLEPRGGVYALTFESLQDLTSYVDVVITEETEADGLDNKPEAHVLEGTF